MTLVTSTGVRLDETDMTKSMDQWAKRAGVNVKAVLATHPDERQEYVLIQNQEPVFASQSAEGIAAHIDIMSLAQKD